MLKRPIITFGTGGTFFMGLDEQGNLCPIYGPDHIMLTLSILRNLDALDSGRVKSLLDTIVDTKRWILPVLGEPQDSLKRRQADKKVERALEKAVTALNDFMGHDKSPWKLEDFRRELGEIKTPYVIDSIIFDFENPAHYQALLAESMQQLDAGNNLVIIGGTDTEEWYATGLAYDLRRRGYLQEGSGQKAVFLSSAYSFEAEPMHNAGVLQAAFLVMESTLEGALALVAKDKNVATVAIHNVLSGFMKVSAIADPFRSFAPVATILNDVVIPADQIPHDPFDYTLPIKKDARTVFGKVAPSLLGANTTGEIIAYLKAVLRNGTFDAVIIEGLPGRTSGLSNPADLSEITKLTEMLCDQGTQVIFNNNHRYDHTHRRVDAKVPLDSWKDSEADGHLAALRQGGAKAWKMTGKDAYLQAAFNEPVRQKNPPQTLEEPIRKIPTIGIRYVPFSSAFEEGLIMAASVANEVVISALAGNGLPRRHKDLIDTLTEKGTKIVISFSNNGQEVVHGLKEGAAPNKYEPAEWCNRYSAKTLPPRQVMRNTRKEAAKEPSQPQI